MRPEYDFSKLRAGTRGKYYRQAKAGSNLVLIEPELARAFPDDKSVNEALKLLLSAAQAATEPFHRKQTQSRKRSRSKAAGT